jgi:hypothetical protein
MVLPLLLSLSSAGPPASAPAGRVVEEVVAVIRNPAGAPPRAITLTRLQEEARVALVARGGTEAALRPLDAAALRAALVGLVDEMLVADEATRLRVDEVAREDVIAEIRRFRERFPSAEHCRRFLDANDLSEEELGVVLARALKVQRYLASRVGRSVRVTDEEVDRFLATRGAALQASGAREVIRARLADEKRAAHVKDLLLELRSRAEIRILDPALGGA